MRRRTQSAVLILLGIGCLAVSVAAQNPAQQQNVTVTVVNAHQQPPQPVKAVRVSLRYLDSSVQITDARDVTNTQGQALLLVSSGVSERGGLRIVIEGANELVIYQPPDGQLPSLGSRVEISLLPKGSPLLLGPAQVEAMLHRTLLQVSSLQKENLALKSEVAAQQSQKPDLDTALADWAAANGFPASQAVEQVQQWAQDIQRQSAQATIEQKALAEFALKHYASAAQLFNQAADADSSELDAEEQAFLSARRDKLRKLISDREQSASAYQLNLQYSQATQTLESAERTAAAEYKRQPNDKGFHELWLQAFFAKANAHLEEGEISPASQSLPLLAQSADDFRSVAGEYDSLGDRRDRTVAELSLGIALMDEAERATGDKATALSEQAVDAYRRALEVFTKADLPQDWATTQCNLGVALTNEAIRTTGDKATALFDQAVQAYRRALEVYTKADLPQDWATTQDNLGDALIDEAIRTSGDRASALFDQAMQAYQRALEIRTKADLPQDWAATQNNLAIALMDEAERGSGGKAPALFDQAVQAYQRALEVYTKGDLPQDWAMTQNNLGVALMDEAERASGDKAPALYEQAVEAYQKALEVYTKADLPQAWGTTQNNLGSALKDEAILTSGDRASALLNQAVQAYQRALEVRTKADLPQDWAATQNNLGITLKHEAERSSGDKASALFEQAVQAYQKALEVYTKADLPQNWATTQNNLGNALMGKAERASGDKASVLFEQAVEAYRRALEVYTKSDLPQDWAETQSNLGDALIDEAIRTSRDRASALFDQGMQAYQRALEVLTKADLPQAWATTEMNVVSASLAAGRFDSCLEVAAALGDDFLSPSRALIRDSLKFACQWAAGNKSAALKSETSLSSRGSELDKGSWDLTGLLPLFATSPAFARGRPSWIALFTSLQNGDSAGMTAALHELEPLMQQ